MLQPDVSRYLEAAREKHLAKLLELLRFPSIANVQGERDQCGPCAAWLAEYLSGLGLKAEVLAGEGKPTVIAALDVSSDAPTLLIYGHYDVQPPDPLELWDSAPFDPVVRDGCIFARGASDNKGQLFAHMMAIDACLQTSSLPVNLKLLIEGEEEIGSPHLEGFMAAHVDRLAADAAVISDSSFFAEGIPSITYALRGLVYVELTVTGPSCDVHSGQYGGLVRNPANALAAMVASMHDADGRVTVEGFYDDVVAVTDDERRMWRSLPFEEEQLAASLGVEALAGGEDGCAALVRRWARPTLDCNGIVGGYTQAGSKTIIPARASAKISMRLVANQDPEKVAEAFKRFVAARTPPGVRSEVAVSAKARPVVLSTDSPAMRAAKAAMAEAFGAEVALVRSGASVPVTELIQRLLGLDAVLMGFGLPDDGMHGPNERLKLDQLWRGSVASAALMHNLGQQAVPDEQVRA
ncbi:MAG: dipeptidase [Phycisphaerae bacterium]|nr:dipeptidase [Phycisphaerae bacterium]